MPPRPGHGLRVVAAADTHLHADFLSGATRLAARDGAVVYASAAGGRRFPHTGLGDGDEVDLGGLTLRAWSTPGHTGEHVAYLLADGDTVLGVFTGGSLSVGAAARTDLVTPERTEPLARAQYASLRRLATLPEATAVWPTHGAGSFCSAAPGAGRTSTIGRERATNPLLAAENEDDFVGQLLGGLGSFPPYFLRLAEANRHGPSLPPGDGGLPSLTPRQVTDIPGAEVIDVRPPAAYAGGHIRGSLAIPLRAQFATWLGWLVPDPGTPLVFVRDPNQDPDEIVWQARKIGYDNLVGELAAASPPGPRPDTRWRRCRCSTPRRSPRVRWTRPASSTSGRTASTRTVTCPRRGTSSWARCPLPPCRPAPWSRCAGMASGPPQPPACSSAPGTMTSPWPPAGPTNGRRRPAPPSRGWHERRHRSAPDRRLAHLSDSACTPNLAQFMLLVAVNALVGATRSRNGPSCRCWPSRSSACPVSPPGNCCSSWPSAW